MGPRLQTQMPVKVHVRWQGFSNMACDWLATVVDNVDLESGLPLNSQQEITRINVDPIQLYLFDGCRCSKLQLSHPFLDSTADFR